MSNALDALKQVTSTAPPADVSAVAVAAKTSATSPKGLTTAEKWKALDAVAAALNKQFSTPASLIRLGDKAKHPVPSFSTGIYTLDHEVIQTGGIPKGRVIEVFGPESSGKTTFCLHCVAQEQKRGELAAFVDAEHALDPQYAKKLGVDTDNLLVSQPDFGEQALETVEALVRSRAVSVIVVDSVAALVPKAEVEGEMGDSHMGLHARLMSQAMRKLTAVCSQTGVTVLFINQIREKVGVIFGSPEVTTGGRALKFYASLRLDIRKLGGAENQIKSGNVLIGHKMKIKAVKNKVGSPFRETIVDLIYGVGIDTLNDFTEYAVSVGAIQQKGAWYVLPDKAGTQFQGMARLKDGLKDSHEAMEAVKAEVLKAQAAQREADAT